MNQEAVSTSSEDRKGVISILTERLLKENIIVIVLCLGMAYMGWQFNGINERVFQIVENNTKVIERNNMILENQYKMYLGEMNGQHSKIMESLNRLETQVQNLKK